MKKLLCLILTVAVVLSMAACASEDKNWQTQYDLGMRYLENGDYEEAILAFTAAIEIDGNRPEAYIGRAEAYIAIGEPEKALKDYKKAQKVVRRSEEDYEDLLEELEERIGDLEEEIDRTENENSTGADEKIWSDTYEYEVSVTDAVTGQFTNQFGNTCNYHIPQILLKNDLAAGINSYIYNELITCVENQIGSLDYIWGVEDDLLSVTVQLSHGDYDWIEYFVYTISMGTGEMVSGGALLAAYEMDMDGFYQLAGEMLTKQMNHNYSTLWFETMDNSEFDSLLNHTLSEENLSKSVPLIGATGHLCMVARTDSPAGAGYVINLYDLQAKEQLIWIPSDDSADAFAHKTANDLNSDEIDAIHGRILEWGENAFPGYGFYSVTDDLGNVDTSDLDEGIYYVMFCYSEHNPDSETGSGEGGWMYLGVVLDTGELYDFGGTPEETGVWTGYMVNFR